ncbi:4a-hydroxytetrahydrobiopterin dehydratase [Cyanobium sp. ATX 6F1]|uniref:4a-hydroxytetrahydrobiopterin dehydratase n=1 Tax=unclassified Cyanobium TaxID=2627006 RepID=UPI0020CEEA39|nr:4a-hydroxytetrahydrobiopterin dehydratase [Cyanobium sp. ATX 6F1]MCP9915524.1 4a-hydroxytetrahydrobiopterin dehydratase [Cyanobium sp. ATX 6F1]
MDQPWTPRPKPEQAVRLERRVEFADYASNRAFLDRLNDFCEQQGRYPDISFGRTYVNITLRADGEGEALSDADHSFAAAIDGLLS